MLSINRLISSYRFLSFYTTESKIMSNKRVVLRPDNSDVCSDKKNYDTIPVGEEMEGVKHHATNL
jgi:hypothetical protein